MMMFSRAVRSRSSARAFSNITRIGTDDPRMSKIVVHSGVVYISGQTDTTGDCIREQTRNVLTKVDNLLKQAGTSKSNLLTASIWLKDISSDFKPMNEVWNDWLDPENKPVRATVESPMARPQILVEIQVTAATND
jgi:enamine deaminase RidA (YjgF/YER057c/UK114 family)